MLDLLIKGGKVVSPESVTPLDVGIVDGRIAMLAAPGTVTVDAGRIVNARPQFIGTEPALSCRIPIQVRYEFPKQ